PYFGAPDADVDARRARCRGGGPGRDAGDHRVASRTAVGGHGGRRIDPGPDRRGPTDLHRRHGRFRNRRRRVRLVARGPREGPDPGHPGLPDSGVWPPRGAFGHLFGILAGIGGDWAVGNLTDELGQATNHLRSLRKALRPESGVRSNRAKSLALRIRSTVPVTYGAGPFVAIARRWQTQLNENAKVLAFSSTFPEADHNELVGWVEDARARTHRAILLRDRDEAPDLRRQLDITVSLMSRKAKVEQVHDEGPTLVSRMLGTLFRGDY